MSSVNLQVAMLLVTVLLGVAVGVAYDLYRGLRRAARSGQAFTIIGDVIFWSAATVFVFRGLIFGNGGELRSYVFLGAGAGLYFYFQMASPTVLWVAVWFWRTVLAVFRLLWLGCRMVVGGVVAAAAAVGRTIGAWGVLAGRFAAARLAPLGRLALLRKQVPPRK